MDLFKIGDSSPQVTEGSKLEEYWEKNPMQKFWPKIRPGLKLPKDLQKNDPNHIGAKFNLKGIGFGNWVTVEDRINYLHALTLALYDLNKVLKFNHDMGMGLLSVTFGARGTGGALAHYEPWSHYINISRYKDNTWFGAQPKEVRFFGTGGVGSFAHEYGHFLDYVFGGHVLNRSKFADALTGGKSIARDRAWDDKFKAPLLVIMDDLMEKIIWKDPGKKESRYYKALTYSVENTSKGNYWIQRNEIFARAFEAFIEYELRQRGIKNLLLAKSNYSGDVYLRQSEIKAVRPLFLKLIREMGKLRSKR